MSSRPCIDKKKLKPTEAMTFSYTLDRENRHLIIDEGSTEIPANVFESSITFDTVTIPDTVEVIGDRAFSGTSLDEVEILDSVQIIGDDAFSQNFELIRVQIGESVTTIGRKAFYAIGIQEISDLYS